MRILHVIPQFSYFGGRTIVGGHASCLLTLAIAQHRAGHEVTILSYVAGSEGPVEIVGGPVVHSLFSSAATRTVRFGLLFCHRAAEWARLNRDAYDVIHVHSGYADYFLVSQRLKSVARLPTLHTMYCPIAPYGRARWPGVHGLINQFSNRLDGLVGISHNVVSSMTRYGMRGAECVRPALDVDRFSDREGTRERDSLGIAADDPVVLFVGNATQQKNMTGALHAAQQLRGDFPRLKLIVTTELEHTSSNADMAKLAKEIGDLQLGTCVIQKGIVDNMPALMQACDVLVAPFLDSFGPSDYFMAALEAMAAGKPVVVSDVGGMREIISDEVGRLVDPRDYDAIAEGLRTYLANSELRDRTGRSARAFVTQHFDPSVIVDTYQHIYRRVTA